MLCVAMGSYVLVCPDVRACVMLPGGFIIGCEGLQMSFKMDRLQSSVYILVFISLFLLESDITCVCMVVVNLDN